MKKMEIVQPKKYEFQELEEEENNIPIPSKIGTNHTKKFIYVSILRFIYCVDSQK